MKEGRALGLKPISVAVLDAGGHMVAFAPEDNSSNLRPQIATAKASGALALGVSSRTIGEMAIVRPTFMNATAGLNSAGIVTAAGGGLVRNAGGEIISAVGVTGDTSDNDEKAGLAGIARRAFPPERYRDGVCLGRRVPNGTFSVPRRVGRDAIHLVVACCDKLADNVLPMAHLAFRFAPPLGLWGLERFGASRTHLAARKSL